MPLIAKTHNILTSDLQHLCRLSPPKYHASAQRLDWALIYNKGKQFHLVGIFFC